MRGLFITFEGIEGCGKSTQMGRLEAYLRERGHEVDGTREPGGTPISEGIRGLLLDPANSSMAPMTELLLYESARAQHVAERIKPALDRGVIVLCDRFYDSTTAYQGAGRALLTGERVEALHEMVIQGCTPDLTILLDMDPAEGLARAKRHGPLDRIEGEPLAFHERVRAGFLEIAKREPERVRVIDGMGSEEVIAAKIQEIVGSLLGRGERKSGGGL